MKDVLTQEQKLTELTATHQKELIDYQTKLETLENHLTSSIKKRDDLETSLLNLAQQKLKGKKKAQRLLQELETNYKSKESHYLKDIQQKETTIIGLNNSYDKLETAKKLKEEELETELKSRTQTIQQQENSLNTLQQEKDNLTTELTLYQQKIKDLESQLVSLSQQKISTQQTLTRTHQELTQSQTLYEKRKKQTLFLGIITLLTIILL